MLLSFPSPLFLLLLFQFPAGPIVPAQHPHVAGAGALAPALRTGDIPANVPVAHAVVGQALLCCCDFVAGLQ